MDKTLIYCTTGYPGDLYSEKVFADSEINALLAHFDRIILLPVDDLGHSLGFEDELPEGVEVDWSLTRQKATHSRLIKLFYIFHPYVARSLIDVTREARTPRQWLKGFMQAANTVTIARAVRKVLRRNNLTPENSLLYSLWFLDTAAANARIAAKYGWKCATRGHTTDMYDTPRIFRSVAVRRRLLNHIDSVISISEHGRDYLADKFPEHSVRFKAIHLGSSRNLSPCEYTPADGISEPLEIFTVARIADYKRLPLVVDTVRRIARYAPDRKLKWTLIGDGDYRREELIEQIESADEPNLELCYAGMIPNDKIQELYSTRPPQWFMLMSEIEGIPVAMGEAMSYGVPVVTTAAGQTCELADGESAFIFPINVDPDECARALAAKIFDPATQRAMSRAAIKAWEDRFNTAALARRTAAILAALLNKKMS